MTLRLDWASREAAEYACRHWHYSRTLPSSRLIVVGVWELPNSAPDLGWQNGSDAFRGVVTFSRGATPAIGSPYGLTQTEICELTRIALREHETPVSRIVAIALKMLKRRCPGLRLVVSYAAGEQGHHGGVYQAGGWIYVGAMESHGFIVKGAFRHARSLTARYGLGGGTEAWLRAHLDPDARKIRGLVRHKYLMPFDAEMRAKTAPLAKPYPKRPEA
jgi:hypothetical protein